MQIQKDYSVHNKRNSYSPSFCKLHLEDSVSDFGQKNINRIVSALDRPEMIEGKTIRDIIAEKDLFLSSRKSINSKDCLFIRLKEEGIDPLNETIDDSLLTSVYEEVELHNGEINEINLRNTIFYAYLKLNQQLVKLQQKLEKRQELRPNLNRIEDYFNK